MTGLTAIDLFAGAGGLSLGLRWAGYRVLAAVELDDLAAETYRLNHPDTLVVEADIRDVDPVNLSRTAGLALGGLHLLAGCPPCQGFSTMRTLNGARTNEDPRNDLLFEYHRFVEALRPAALMFENVPGLARDARFEAFTRAIEKMGYHLAHGVLDAADFSVPQRRRRLVLLGSRLGPVRLAQKRWRRVTVRDALAGLPEPGDSGDPLHDLPVRHAPHVADLIARIPKDGGSRRDAEGFEQLPCHRRCDGFADVYGRMKWDEPSPTITSGCVNPSKGRFLHPEQDRAVTLREAALLQTLPRGYQFSLRRGKYAAAEMIGNALPPRFAKAQAQALSFSGTGPIGTR